MHSYRRCDHLVNSLSVGLSKIDHPFDNRLSRKEMAIHSSVPEYKPFDPHPHYWEAKKPDSNLARSRALDILQHQ